MAKNVDELPSGFRIENYAGVASFGQQEWAANIEHRLLIRSFLNMGKQGNDDGRTAAGTLIESLLRNPVVTEPPRPSLGTLLAKAKLPRAVIPNRMPPLAAMTVDRWRKLGQFLGSAMPEKTVRQADLQPVDAFVPNEDLIWGDRLAHVVINLDASDQEIRKALGRVLSEARGRLLKKTTPLTPRHMQQWHDNAVLPYADLVLWQEWTGRTLSEEKLIQALSRDVHGVEKPLKGAKRDYAKVLTPETAALLKQRYP